MNKNAVFLAILLTAVFGAAIVDVVFVDVVPIRPYDTFFKWIPSFSGSEAFQGHAVKTVFTVGFLILVLAAMLPTIANATTGITIAHSGFTPNPNITATPGDTSLIRIVPLVFGGVGIGLAIDELPGIL